jgi:ribokinase
VTGRVIVIGSVNIDLVATVDRLPLPGETVGGATFARHPGGKGGNQATAAARLGARVAFVGAVGEDLLAGEARDALVAEGVDVAELASVAGPTGVALILVDRRGENMIAVAPGANATVTNEMGIAALERLGCGPGDVVLVSHEIPTPAVFAVLRAARRSGATTILNPAPARGLDRSLLEWTDIAVPNRLELIELFAAEDRRTGAMGSAHVKDPAEQAAWLLEPRGHQVGPEPAVVVTLGDRGALIVRRETSPIPIEAPAVQAVDTVGAGDTFVGALAASIAAGSELDAAVRRAVVAASLSTTRAGARGGMPTAPELEAALAAG